MDLSSLAGLVRDHPGTTGKAALRIVAETLGGDGDDAALLADGDGWLVMAAEAVAPAFALATPRVAGVAGARPGDAVCLATCLEGELGELAGEGSFFSHLRGPRRGRAAEDLALLADAAEAGEAWAGRDVSMPGVAGSLLQLAESAGGLGATLDLEALPRPHGVELARWLVTFPSYGFLLAGDPAALGARFGAAGLTCVPVGRLDDSGVVRLAGGGDSAEVWDLGRRPLTGLRPA